MAWREFHKFCSSFGDTEQCWGACFAGPRLLPLPLHQRSASESLKKKKKHEPPIVILDLQSPQLIGYLANNNYRLILFIYFAILTSDLTEPQLIQTPKTHHSTERSSLFSIDAHSVDNAHHRHKLGEQIGPGVRGRRAAPCALHAHTRSIHR